MRLLSLLSLFRRPAPKPPTVSQEGIQARAIRHLIATGWIDAATIWRMGTTDAHKMISRMRRLGLVGDANDPNSYTLIVNPATGSRIRRHKWTGKLPDSMNPNKMRESWAKRALSQQLQPTCFPPLERRSRKRGQ